MRKNDAAPLYQTKCYFQSGILFVPHYTESDKFVHPGYIEEHGVIKKGRLIEESELISNGAVPVISMLWHRAKLHPKHD